MKHFFIGLFTVLCFSFIAEAQQQQELTPESIQRRLERNENRIDHQKHSQRPKTWVDRGIILQDAFDVNIQYLYFGMPKDETTLFMGDPKEIRTEETELGVREVLVYENVEVYFEGGRLTGWNETEVIHNNPLEEAYQAFEQAIELEEKGESGGFFSRIFGGSQERRITDAFLRLHGQFISQAVLEYEERDFEAAFHSFQRSIDVADSPYFTEPLDSGLIFNTGFVAGLAGKPEESLHYLTRARDMGYGDGSIYVLIKDAHIELGDSLSAERTLQEGFERYPDDNALLVDLVNFYIHSQNEEEALNYLQLAKEQEPDNATFHYAEGALYDQMGELDKAEEAYYRSLELDPDFFNTNYNLGLVYFNRAVKMLEAANEIMDNREYEKARDEAFEVLAEAIPYLEHAHSLNPGDEPTMETLRIIYYRLDMEQKLEEMNRKLGREPLE